jgi:hypothetical protein
MFQLYSHHQAHLQSLVELHKLNACAMWDPSSEAKSVASLLGSYIAFSLYVKLDQ